MNHCFIVMLEVAPSWLALTREQRREYAAGLYRIIERHASKVRVRYFDADAFSGACSDFVICETDNTLSYHHLWEEMKDSEVFGSGYFKIKDVLIGIQNAYQQYETEVLGMEAEAYTT